LKRLKLERSIVPYDMALFSKGYTMSFVKNSTYPELPKLMQDFERELIAMKKTANIRN